ncbi:MAG: hypothetical protein P8105_08815 [Dehalococcoidia bacterium]
MSRKFKLLAVAAVLVIVLLAVFAGAACTGNVNADDEVIQSRYGQNGIQGQNNNGDCDQLCDGTCTGTESATAPVREIATAIVMESAMVPGQGPAAVAGITAVTVVTVPVTGYLTSPPVQ